MAAISPVPQASAGATDWLPDQADIQAIVHGSHPDPFGVLGLHARGGRLSVRAFLPDADEASVLDDAGNTLVSLQMIDASGFFAGVLPEGQARFRYRLRKRRGDHEWVEFDPYGFGPVLGDMDMWLIAEGRHRRIYEKLGAHPMRHGGVDGVAFALWAPNARRVSVVGHFNGWDGRRHAMRKRHEAGIWEVFIPTLVPGDIYKFEIISTYGYRLPLKADPVGFAHEPPPATASVVAGLPTHQWTDGNWLAKREEAQALDAPVSIYEVHLGSWRRRDGNEYLSYDELADELLPYVKWLGFTHIELMPVSEHPFSGSWGYQPIGLFAPTSRFGDPDGFARFVDRAHKEGIGVVIDWVPAHFPSDAHGLARFDGTALYEHEDPRLGFHRDWNTLIYNFGRREVSNFLVANALFWFDKFHVDALRVDAVASMLYLDYSRNPGEWIPNVYGGRENLDAEAFLREMNTLAFGDFPGVQTMAEESTAWPGVSRPVDGGGLGFGYKWNMGWMHDTLHYMQEDPINRRYHQNDLTFGLIYAFTENFILPLSHDEVVHGKGSLLAKMPGDRWQKFANLRAYFGFMWGHPGKKLLFMGGEFAQEREWNHDQSLDWHLTHDPFHAGVQALVRDLNRLYREMPALHALDCSPDGFEWVDASDDASSVVSFLRKPKDGGPVALVVCNFTPVVRPGYRVGVPHGGRWVERLNTDAGEYGGSDVGNGGIEADREAWNGRPASLLLTLPPLATMIFTPA